MSRKQIEDLDFGQKHLIEQMAAFLLAEAEDDKSYDKDHIDKIKKVRGYCWGLCATLAKNILVDRHLESKKSSEIKAADFIHDSAWFQKSRELLASWRRDKHSLYSKIDKRYMLEFIQIILSAQHIERYLSKELFINIETSLQTVAQDDKSLNLQLKLVGGVARFFTPRDLEKVLGNFLIKKQRFLFLCSKTHVGLIYFDKKVALQFYEPNYKKSAIMKSISVAEIMKYFIEEFPDTQYGDRFFTEIYSYQSADDKDTDFPTPEEIEELCTDKNTGDSCGSPDFPYSQSRLNIDKLILFIPYFKYNMDKLVEKTSKKIAKMMLSAMIGNIETLNKMISNSTNLDEKDHEQKTMLMYAAFSNRLEFLQLLISKGVDLNARDIYGNTALMCAIDNKNNKIFDELLASGADPLISNSFGKTVFDYAERLEKYETIKTLLNYRDARGKNLLMLACESENYKLIEKLIKLKVDVNSKNSMGRTALFIAAVSGHLDIVKLLLKNNADFLLTDKNGKTALDYAQKYGHAEVVKLLRESQDELLKEYAKDNNISGMKKLLDSGAPVDSKNSRGRTALFYAAAQGQIEAVKFLLQAHADPHIADHKKNQPFDYAFQKRNMEVCWLLLGGKRDDRSVRSISVTPGVRG